MTKYVREKLEEVKELAEALAIHIYESALGVLVLFAICGLGIYRLVRAMFFKGSVKSMEEEMTLIEQTVKRIVKYIRKSMGYISKEKK